MSAPVAWKRFVCWLWTGHEWAYFPGEPWPGRVEYCTRCGETQ